MEPTLEQMARSLVESGDYRVTSRLGPQDEYHPPDDTPKLVAAAANGISWSILSPAWLANVQADDFAVSCRSRSPAIDAAF